MSESTHEPSSHPTEPPAAVPNSTTGEDDLLAALADEFAERVRRQERPAVEEYAAKHPELADRIRKLFPTIALMEESRSFDAAATAGGEGPGGIIGRYKLLEWIGEGGFGVVYMAEQQHPVRRKVALKVVKPGMDSRQVLARFDAERQALAIMDHPNIARVLDAGATDAGRPYFVMELIKGVPITEFCDQSQLTPRERLELFAHVCHAVQHAHQKGIIHRDIKPSNVLVMMHDTTPLVKVIDFGVAKALGQELTDKTLFTGFAQLLGTPLYMSPEQAGQSSLDVDTRSDVYSLGVLLYELLTGTTPFDKERFQQAAHDEIRRIIREEEPPRPSTRLSESKDALASISAQRHTEPAKLTRLVRGELDWIVMKALEKERARRYETAIGMARDVERYLNDEPVEACPASTMYRLRKVLRRNQGPVLAAALVLLTLVGGIVGTTFGLVRAEQARRAETERAEGELQARQEAQAVLDFVVQKVFAAARPEGQEGGLGHDVTLRRAIEAALPFVDESFADRPLIEARLRQTLGISFLNLGEPKKAEEQLEKSRAIRTKELGPDHPDTLKSIQGLANSYSALGWNADALKLREETLTLAKAKLGPEHPDTLSDMNNLAYSYSALGRDAEALKLNEETLALRKAKLGPDHPETLGSMINLANSYNALGRSAEALKLREETLTLAKAKLGPDHPDTLKSIQGLANSYAALGRHADALKLREETLALRKAKLGPDHPDTLASMVNLAASYRQLGRSTEAVKLCEEALPVMKAKIPDAGLTFNCMAQLAYSYEALGRHADALKLHEETLALRKAKLGPDHPYTLGSMCSLANSYAALGRHADALRVMSDAIRLHPDNANFYGVRASAYAAMGQWDKAAADYEKQLQLNPKDHWPWYFRGCMLAYLGRKQEYGEHCRAMLAQFADTTDHGILEQTTKTALLLPGGVGGDMEQLSRRVERACELSPNSPWRMLLKGLAECRAGRYEEAIGPLEKCRAVPPDDFFVQGGAVVTADALLAIARYQLGEVEEARAALDRANDQARKLFPPVGSGDWSKVKVDHWLIAQIALREAEVLILGQQATTTRSRDVRHGNPNETVARCFPRGLESG